MMMTPLLPLFCPSPVAGRGSAHSTWIWASPKLCLVVIEPVRGLTIKAPSLISHSGALPPRPTHAFRLEPSKRTTASDGTPAEENVIVGGMGRSISFGNHLSLGDCAIA